MKIGLNDEPPAILEDDSIAYCKRHVCMTGNNSAMARVLTGNICKKFDKMYKHKAFVHWYLNEGMEEGEFEDARENLGFLEKDYMDVISDYITTDEEL